MSNMTETAPKRYNVTELQAKQDELTQAISIELAEKKAANQLTENSAGARWEFMSITPQRKDG